MSWDLEANYISVGHLGEISRGLGEPLKCNCLCTMLIIPSGHKQILAVMTYRDRNTHTERDTQALRETHTHNLEGETHTLSNTQRHYKRDPLHRGRHTMRQKHTHGERDTLGDTQTETL